MLATLRISVIKILPRECTFCFFSLGIWLGFGEVKRKPTHNTWCFTNTTGGQCDFWFTQFTM